MTHSSESQYAALLGVTNQQLAAGQVDQNRLQELIASGAVQASRLPMSLQTEAQALKAGIQATASGVNLSAPETRMPHADVTPAVAVAHNAPSHSK